MAKYRMSNRQAKKVYSGGQRKRHGANSTPMTIMRGGYRL